MDRSRLIQQTAPTTHSLTVNRKSSPSTIKSMTAIQAPLMSNPLTSLSLAPTTLPLPPTPQLTSLTPLETLLLLKKVMLLIAGQLSSSDLDNNATASYSLIGAAIPGLTINSDGSWSFNPADSAYNDLSEGELKTITVNYSVTDDQNAVDTGSFNHHLTGINDAPEATYDRSQCAGRRF